MAKQLNGTKQPVATMRFAIPLLLLASLCSGTSLDAADSPNQQQQVLVLQMVDQHLPQLKTVLDYLRENSPQEYERAMRDLSRQMRRLETSRRRGEHFYDNELQVIKLETAIDLAAAKLRLRDEPELRQQLRRDIRQLQQLRVERLMFERQTLAQRLKRTTEQLAAVEQRLEKAQQSLDANAEQSFQTLLRKAGRSELPRTNDKRLRTQKPLPDAPSAPVNRTKRSPQS